MIFSHHLLVFLLFLSLCQSGPRYIYSICSSSLIVVSRKEFDDNKEILGVISVFKNKTYVFRLCKVRIIVNCLKQLSFFAACLKWLY